nr:hypothetical protein [Lactococcus protaetiae]
MMKNTLRNSQLTVVIDSFGAELNSIKSNDIEYLWQADQNFWARHAQFFFLSLVS